MLHGLGARWYALAKLKEQDAPFLHLAQAASYVTQRGTELLAVAEGRIEPATIDVQGGPDERLERIKKWVKEEATHERKG
jgi:hypothetical protein